MHAVANRPNYIRPRQITDADLPEIADLLTRGFESARPRDFWLRSLACLSRRAVPSGHPRYGYVLESDGKIVGSIIMIFSTIYENGVAKVRGNCSSWYVDSAYRPYAQLLVSHALKQNEVTILNVTAADHTLGIIEGLGFKRYNDGLFFSVPLLSKPAADRPVRVVDANVQPDVPFDLHERDLLLEHVEYGCVGLWCITRERAYPFLFRPRPTRKLVPCVQLVFCHHLDSFVRYAFPIGVHLAQRLQLIVSLDANGDVSGLIGKYRPGRMPKYFYGPDPPRLGDLAYTETSMFGV